MRNSLQEINMTEGSPLIYALESLWCVIAPYMERLEDREVFQEMFATLHEQDDPLDYLQKAFELHKKNPPINFEELVGIAVLAVGTEPVWDESNFRSRIKMATKKIQQLAGGNDD